MSRVGELFDKLQHFGKSSWTVLPLESALLSCLLLPLYQCLHALHSLWLLILLFSVWFGPRAMFLEYAFYMKIREMGNALLFLFIQLPSSHHLNFGNMASAWHCFHSRSEEAASWSELRFISARCRVRRMSGHWTAVERPQAVMKPSWDYPAISSDLKLLQFVSFVIAFAHSICSLAILILHYLVVLAGLCFLLTIEESSNAAH